MKRLLAFLAVFALVLGVSAAHMENAPEGNEKAD